MNFEVLIVAKLIRDAKLTQPVKEKVTACTFYGVKADDDVDFKARFRRCKARYISKATQGKGNENKIR